MNSDADVVVKDAYISYSDEPFGELDRLYTHQLQTIESESSVIVLDAPTGSGKTLASLARVIRHETPAIFVYPTNTLVKDQVSAMQDLLKKLGMKPLVIGEKGVDWTSYPGDTDIDLIHLTGESLQAMAGDSAKGSVIDRILTHSRDRMRILLTNPDTIYLAFVGKYHRHGRITEQLGTFQTLVIDEFHLYSGPTLARVFFMLNELRGTPKQPLVDLIYLSATHGETLSLLENTYAEIDVISVPSISTSSPNNRQIRHETLCHLKTQSQVMTSNDDIEDAASQILHYFEKPLHESYEKCKVKVLGVFSSVIFAVRVARAVAEELEARGINQQESLYQIHGLIPRNARPDIEQMNKAILIGTSAIEVGIDFDVPYLVMEGHDLASFLQRFGRGGRHGPCECTMYVPLPMATRMASVDTLSFDDFILHSQDAFKELPSYTDFLCSPEVRPLLLAMALAASKDPFSWTQDYDLKDAADFFVTLVDANCNTSTGDVNLRNIIGSLSEDDIEFELNSRTVETMAENGFLRGTMNSVLARFNTSTSSDTGGSVYTELDVLEMFRLTGHIEEAEKHWDSIPSPIKGRHSQDEPIFVLDDIERTGYPRVSARRGNPYENRIGVYLQKHVTVRFPDKKMAGIADQILHDRNIVFLWRRPDKLNDFRIPRLYLSGGSGALVVGDWALVAAYLHRIREQEDEKL